MSNRLNRRHYPGFDTFQVIVTIINNKINFKIQIIRLIYLIQYNSDVY